MRINLSRSLLATTLAAAGLLAGTVPASPVRWTAGTLGTTSAATVTAPAAAASSADGLPVTGTETAGEEATPATSPTTSTAATTATDRLLAGAARLDSTWNVGASAGQYAGEDNGYTVSRRDGGGDVGAVDPYTHSPTSRASYGIQGRESVRALVVQEGGPEGHRFALVSNDLYIPQDVLTRRVGQLLEDHDLRATSDPTLTPTGITAENLVISVSHSHSSPFYSSTTWGPWVFEDVFDIRYFEHIARRMAEAVIEAAGDLRPVRMGASQSDFRMLKRHSFGPLVDDAGLPGGFPEVDVDGDLTVLAFDDVTDPATPTPLATWVVWGMHPEMTDDEDLLTSEWVQTMYRYTDREIGGVTLFSQRDTGTAEISKDGRAHEPQLRQEFDHRGYSQVDHAGRLISAAVEMNRAAISAGPDGVDPVIVRTGEALPRPHDIVPWRTDAEVGVTDLRFAPPGARPSQTVSNCRTEKAFDGNPGIPLAGLPDCNFSIGDAFGRALFDQLQASGVDPDVVYDELRAAGVPVPDNYGVPSAGSLQESATVHLQAIRLGDIAITVCPCEQWADQTRNIESRLDDVAGNLWFGFDWTANPLLHPGFQQGVIYDGQDLPGHGPLTLPDATGEHWCRQDADTSWTCRNPTWHRDLGLPAPGTEDGKWLPPVSHDTFMRMKAQIYNDAAGWDDMANLAAAEFEPVDNADVWGNFTHEELYDATGGGYQLVVPLAMSNDYMGYIASYREFQNHDHYRKALTGLGPHSSDFLATRLTRMAAALKGGPAVELTPKDLAYAAEDERTEVVTRVIGEAANVVLRAFEAVTPADGGVPEVTAQPADVERFDAARVSWVGGSTFTDSPRVVVQRFDESGAWVDFANGEGEVQLIPDFPDLADGDLALWASGQYAWTWTATFEAYAAPFPQPDLQGVRHWATPSGTYRFVIAGCHRGGPPTGPNVSGVDACESADPAARVVPYQLVSDPFEVRPWSGLTVEDLQAAQREVSFLVGPAPEFPVTQSNMDHVYAPGSVAPVDFRDSYVSPFDYIREQAEVKEYAAGPDDERFCFHCSFRPWADTGGVSAVPVTIERANGRSDVLTATWDPTAGRMVLRLDGRHMLRAGDVVRVPPGAVRDDLFGETNAEGASITWHPRSSPTSLVSGD